MRYIDADALVKAIPSTFHSTTALRTQIVSLIVNQPTVGPPAPVPVTPPPTAGVPTYRASKVVAFDAPYSDASNWTSGRTSAFPDYYNNQAQFNPGDSKLDVISESYLRPSDNGEFRATPAASYAKNWATQLVTTEGSAKSFQVQTGDVVAFDFTPTAQNGAWPACWTWSGPTNEVDLFEYHGDNPTTIELTNHVRPSKPDYPKILAPGKTSHIEVVLGGLSVDWYVDGVQVFVDQMGVGSNFKAYLIANLSVQAGNQYHPGPDAGATSLTARIANVKVYR